MPTTSRHPLHGTFLPDWELLADCYRGERVVKDKGELYLPATSGMHLDGMLPDQIGWKRYQAYKMRAVFPDFIAEAVEGFIGAMHQKPATIELPAAMEPLRDAATPEGESLQGLLRRINETQLVSGRLGLHADLPSVPVEGLSVIPTLLMYTDKTILNWDDGARGDPTIQKLNLVALDESEWTRNTSFDWEWKMKTRLLLLGDPIANESEGVYSTGLYIDKEAEYSAANQTIPSLRGRTLDEIPFVFINSKDLLPDPDDPPLLGLARLAMTVYRGEADYRQSLFQQGQDTLVVIGGAGGTPENPVSYRTGAGSTIELAIGGDAKFIGVNSSGLEEQRMALENDRKIAAAKSGQLLNGRNKEAEAAEALKIRRAAETATLTQIAQTAAAGLQKILRIIAKWMDLNPEEVVVSPNLDFDAGILDSKTLVDYMTAKNTGAPWSLQSIHEFMQEKGLTKLSFEEEMDLIEAEVPLTAEPEEDVLGEDEQ